MERIFMRMTPFPIALALCSAASDVASASAPHSRLKRKHRRLASFDARATI
jgi:hypothetical protein